MGCSTRALRSVSHPSTNRVYNSNPTMLVFTVSDRGLQNNYIHLFAKWLNFIIGEMQVGKYHIGMFFNQLFLTYLLSVRQTVMDLRVGRYLSI